MPSLIYSFAQLEAFTAVVECKSLAKAARQLGKDRTTLRDLVSSSKMARGMRCSCAKGEACA